MDQHTDLPITFKRPPEKPITSDKDARSRVPRERRYHVPVDGSVGLRMLIYPTGRKSFESTARGTNGKLQSRILGQFPDLSLAKARALHAEQFAATKRGQSVRATKTEEKRQAERTAKLEQPIVELGLERLERKVNQGEIKNGYNDQWALAKIRAVIGNCSFQEFSEDHAKRLATKYNPQTEWTKADKVKKQLNKIYRSLASDVLMQLNHDIPHLLESVFGTIKQRSRAEELIPASKLSVFWAALIASEQHASLKDALVMMLLTGERKTACLSLTTEQVWFENDPAICFLNTKQGGVNAVPMTNYLGAFLARKVDEATTIFLFPTRRGGASGHLSPTALNRLISDIEQFQAHASPHDLRRTIASVAAMAIGSQPLADEHLLHNPRFGTGASRHYFSQESVDFASARLGTFEAAHQALDDLILSHGEILCDQAIHDGPDEEDFFGCPSRIVVQLGEKTVEIAQIHSTNESKTPRSLMEYLSQAVVTSPLASWCTGDSVTLPLRDYRRLRNRLEREFDLTFPESDGRSGQRFKAAFQGRVQL